MLENKAEARRGRAAWTEHPADAERASGAHAARWGWADGWGRGAEISSSQPTARSAVTGNGGSEPEPAVGTEGRPETARGGRDAGRRAELGPHGQGVPGLSPSRSLFLGPSPSF